MLMIEQRVASNQFRPSSLVQAPSVSEGRMKQHAVDTQTSSDWSREELITLGMALVRRVALQLARRLPSHVELSDLISAGTVGMLHAVESFESARSPHFEPYAKTRIRGAMIDELRANDLLSRHGRSQLTGIRDARSALRQDLGRDPDDGEVATRLGLGLEHYQRLTGELTRRPVLIRLSLAPVAQPGPASAPDTAFWDKDLKERLGAAIAALPEREQRVIRLYYEEGRTQAAIGALLGVTEARISQLLTKATTSLRSLLEHPAGELMTTPPPPPHRPSGRVPRRVNRKP
jgi:RNA polymerase sigma factor for flagellar operon FliA